MVALMAIGVLAGCAPKSATTNTPSNPVQLTYYYPVGVSGPLATVMTNMVNQFNQANPTIHVNPVFSGTYPQTLAKVETDIQGGNPPDVAVLNHTSRLDLIHLNAIVPLDDVVTAGNYYPAFTEPKVNGHYWGVPFQRSTVVLYYNKDAFQKAGLDPSHWPDTWADLVADGQALEKSGITGIEIPSDGTVYWQFEPFVTDGGNNLAGDDGTTVNFNSQAAKDALNFWLDLSHKYKIEPTVNPPLGHSAQRLFQRPHGDDHPFQRQPGQHFEEIQFQRRGGVPAQEQERPANRHRWRRHVPDGGHTAGPRSRCHDVHQVDDRSGTAGILVDQHGICRCHTRCL